MKSQNFKSRLFIGLVLVGFCQALVLCVPVSADLIWETTTWINPSGAHSKGKELTTSDKWYVEWEVLQGGNGKIDFYLRNDSAYVLHSVLQTASGNYLFEPEEDGMYWARFENEAGSSVQIKVITHKREASGIPGYNLLFVIGIITLLSVLLYRKAKLHPKLK